MDILRLATLIASAMTAAVTLTGCAGGGADETGAGQTLDADSARVAWTKCMRENGVDIPDPKDDGKGGLVQLRPGGGPLSGPDAENFREAQQACKEYAEKMGGPAGEELSEDDKERMLTFARCMREHGVDMPDPDFDGSDGQMGILVSPPDDKSFAAAQKACGEPFGSTR